MGSEVVVNSVTVLPIILSKIVVIGVLERVSHETESTFIEF